MTLGHGPSIVFNGLGLYLDPASLRSYPGSGSTWFDISGNGNDQTSVNSVTFASNGTVGTSATGYFNRSSAANITGGPTIVNVAITTGNVTYAVPSDIGVPWTLHAIGGGGLGDGGVGAGTIGAGGGGGAYARISNANVALSPGSTLYTRIAAGGQGNGDTWASISVSAPTATTQGVYAQTGGDGSNGGGGAGGLATTPTVGAVTFAGGAGGNGIDTVSGPGGGGAAGPNGAGAAGGASTGTNPNGGGGGSSNGGTAGSNSTGGVAGAGGGSGIGGSAATSVANAGSGRNSSTGAQAGGGGGGYSIDNTGLRIPSGTQNNGGNGSTGNLWTLTNGTTLGPGGGGGGGAGIDLIGGGLATGGSGGNYGGGAGGIIGGTPGAGLLMLSYRSSQGFTASAWVNIGSTGAIKTIVSSGTSTATQDGWSLRISAAGALQLQLNGVATYTSSRITLATNTWINVAVTLGTTSGTFYANGIAYDTFTPANMRGSTTALLVANDATNNYFVGNLGPVKVYNRVLSASEIARNFNAIRGRYGV